jgi:NAD(P)-dependent dehydrogenase (short-subunit alcohol dehydrogenase family)
MTDNANNVTVITGAAGGMGVSTAKLFAAQGRSILLCDLVARRLQEIAASLQCDRNKVELLAGDISAPSFSDSLLAALGNRRIGALVHTAGITPTIADAARILDVNFTATARLVRTVRSKMAEGSCAVLISSMSAHMVKSQEIDAVIALLSAEDDASTLLPFASSPVMAYPLSKRAMIRLVAREAASFGERGARIVSISPGLIDTALGRTEMAASERTAEMLDRTPLRRLGLADEIASVAAFLCSPAASYITGCDIRVDGGTTAALGL